jgi:multiple sugar transport system permease protein
MIHAARLDGLGEFEIIWRIMIPMTAPALGAFGIFSIVAHWNDLFRPLIAVRRINKLNPGILERAANSS